MFGRQGGRAGGYNGGGSGGPGRGGKPKPKPLAADSATAVTDCFYFFKGGCTKSLGCAFRHSDAARASSKVCPKWAGGGMCGAACPMQHPSGGAHPWAGPPAPAEAAASGGRMVCR